jgi:AraC-like DNA-binding protein
MNDPLSDIFDMIGVESSVYFQKDFCAPWGMQVEDTGFAQFHILVRGTAIARYGGVHEHLNAGDILLFPKGASHVIADSPDGVGVLGRDVIAAHNAGEPMFEGEGTQTRMICGHFEYDFSTQHPLIQEFPDAIIIRSNDLPSMVDLTGILNILIRETQWNRTGSDVLIRKLSEGLLMMILRAYFEISDAQTGFHAALRDPQMANAISAIHQTDWQDLGLNNLALICGMSRSALAKKFKVMVGHSPREYSIRWRLLRATKLLTTTTESIDEIAASSGYGSSTAFARAFQRVFNMTAGTYRRQHFKNGN